MARTHAAGVVGSLAVVAVSVIGMRGMLRRQAAIARRRIGKPLGEQALDADRIWCADYGGAPIEMLVIGDSIAAGLGVGRRKETPGARIAKGVGREVRRPVRLHTGAVVGSESSDLAVQLDALPRGYRADIAIVIVGGNDVTHRVPVSVSTSHLRSAVERLRAQGTAVVVGTCPDLGALRAVPQPLRTLASGLSRRLAAAQAEIAAEAGASIVPLGRAVGPHFFAQPDEMFSLDGFHPSALGYRRTADALLPAVIAALSSEAPNG